MHPSSQMLRKLADDLDSFHEEGLEIPPPEVKFWFFGGRETSAPIFAALRQRLPEAKPLLMKGLSQLSANGADFLFCTEVCAPVVVGKRHVPARIVEGIPSREVPAHDEDIVEFRCGDETPAGDKLDDWDLAGAQAEDRPTNNDDIPF